MTFNVTQSSAPCGAIIEGLDLTKQLGRFFSGRGKSRELWSSSGADFQVSEGFTRSPDMRLGTLWLISGALVVTAGFANVELGPALLRERPILGPAHGSVCTAPWTLYS